MSIQVKHYGDTKPGPGVEPVKVENTPFGKKNPVSFMSGKHVFQPEVKKIDVVYQNRKYTKDTEDWQYSQMEEHDEAKHDANFPAMASLPTDHLFVPDDDSIAPFYTTREAFYWYGEDSAGGMTKTAITSNDDPRNYGEFIKLTRPLNRTEMHLPLSGGGGIPLTGDVWLLNKYHTFDPGTSYKYIVGYANTNTIELVDIVADDPPPNVFVRTLANEQGDIHMGC